MAKRIVNKAERNAERYDAKEMGYQLYEDSLNGRVFDRLMPMIISEQNIILAYRNICKNNGSKTPGTDGKTIVEIQELPIEMVIKTIRNKLNYYQPKKVRRVEIPKDNGKTRPLGIPSIWDRLIQQCVLQVLEPICEAKFHERNNGFRPYRSTQNAIAQCYKMAQLQNLHFVVDVDITGFFDNIDHSKLIRQLWGLGIQDRKLIMIIKQMLKADILFNDIVITPETGTPQGGILSPLLANVVLNELDWWVANQWEMFKIKEGSTGYEFAKVDKEGNVFTVEDNLTLLEEAGFSIEYTENDYQVISDKKGLMFILGQIISNSVKYVGNNLAPRLIFSIADSMNSEQISLSIKDNGTSIPLSDLPFVFDKGFTGDTGSYLSRSTGMGLYLVQKMATDLFITVELKNNSYGGTTVTLTFPKV